MYELDYRDSVPSLGSAFSPRYHVHSGTGVHPVSYPMATVRSFSESKAAGPWSWSFTSI